MQRVYLQVLGVGTPALDRCPNSPVRVVGSPAVVAQARRPGGAVFVAIDVVNEGAALIATL